MSGLDSTLFVIKSGIDVRIFKKSKFKFNSDTTLAYMGPQLEH